MRVILIICISFCLFSCSSNVQNNVIPTDKEMIKIFFDNQVYFEKLKEFVVEDSVICYPAFLSNKNNTENVIERFRGDSLMKKINISRVSNTGYITLEYYTQGGVLWSIDKNYVYMPQGADSAMTVYSMDIDMNEIYHKTNGNCVLYKPLKDGWFIELTYDK